MTHTNKQAPLSQRQEFRVPVKKFLRLFHYMEQLGFDANEIATAAGMDYAALNELDLSHEIQATHFSRLYQITVERMQSLNTSLPWGAGIGSKAFELMCHAIIDCRTLGDVLNRATEYDELLFPVTGYKMSLETHGDIAHLVYHVSNDTENATFAPEQWDRAQHYQTTANTSGLRVWSAFCGWLVGRSMEPVKASTVGAYISDAYHESLNRQFNCPMEYDAERTEIQLPLASLNYRVVHNPDSLKEFLSNTIHWLMATDRAVASTSAAIKSILGRDFRTGIPSFEVMAEILHMSTSSLRRRLLKEGTSYQQLKDQCRCDIAIDLLTNSDDKIQDIGEQLGFTETSSFVRSFRSWTGVTPKAYREQGVTA